MMAFRSLVLTIYTIEGDGLSPTFMAGDHVLVNRWSYGLRTGGDDGLFSYGRLCKQPLSVGDVIAYEDPRDSTHLTVLFGRCQALPGDTVRSGGRLLVVPGQKACADCDYYWVGALGKGNPTDSRTLGFISEQRVIGRAFLIVYSHDLQADIRNGWRSDRFFLIP
jgi:signal peptidase I